MAYDCLLLASAYFVLTLVLLIARAGAAVAPGTWWYTLGLLLTGFLFHAWFWTHGGQTLGLRAWRLRVERADGGPLSWRDALRRYAAALTLLLPPGLGLLWLVFDPRHAAWHDRLSRTRVVRVDDR